MDTNTSKIKIDSNAPIQDWAKSSYEQVPVTSSFNNATPAPINAPVKITPQALQSTTPIIPPAIPISTASEPIIATTAQSTVDYAQAQANAEKALQATGTKAQDEQSKLNQLAMSIFGQKADAQGNQVNLENQMGIQQEQKVLGELNTQIASEQVAMRAEQDKIRNSFASEAQKQVSLNTINDTYGRRLADFAIRQAAATGNISAIQANADRQTKLLTAPLDTKIQYLSTFAQKYADQLSDEQKTKLGLITKDIDAQKANIQDLQKAKASMIAEVSQNGGGKDQAVLAAIQNATDLTTVAQAGSKYIGMEERLNSALDREYKRTQIEKIRADITNQGKTVKPATGAEKTNLSFFNRAFNAVKDIAPVEENFAGKKGAVSALGLSLPSMFQSGEQQSYRQAQRTFTEARLRKESGAAIPNEEYKNDAKTYFVQPGDSSETIAQKQRARGEVLEGIRFSSGNAYNEFYGDTAVQGLKVNGNTYYVGQIIKNEEGKIGVVMPDGSIEVK